MIRQIVPHHIAASALHRQLERVRRPRHRPLHHRLFRRRKRPIRLHPASRILRAAAVELRLAGELIPHPRLGRNLPIAHRQPIDLRRRLPSPHGPRSHQHPSHHQQPPPSNHHHEPPGTAAREPKSIAAITATPPYLSAPTAAELIPLDVNSLDRKKQKGRPKAAPQVPDLCSLPIPETPRTPAAPSSPRGPARSKSSQSSPPTPAQ